jgi:glycosyltransferase involved in cell wall biosynthesis
MQADHDETAEQSPGRERLREDAIGRERRDGRRRAHGAMLRRQLACGVRLAIVVPGGVDRSGTERVIPALLWLIERLAARHETHVFALAQEPEPADWTLCGAAVHNLGFAARARWPGEALFAAARRLRSGLSAHGPFHVVHAFWANNPGFLATRAARTLGISSVVSLAGGELAALPDIGYGGQLHFRERLKTAAALRRAGRVTAASTPMLEAARAHGADAALVPLGVPRESFAEPVPRDGSLRLLLVGSLNRVKDVPTALRALRRVVDELPAAHLDVVGEDVLAGEVPRAAFVLGLAGHVTFHGFLPADALLPFYRRADLLVHSSRHEAGPLVVLEAAACRVPTVGTATGHVREMAPAAAWAVPVGDDAALAEGILALLADAPRRRAMGNAARAWAEARDADATAASFERIYAEACGAPRRAGRRRP